MNSTTRTITAIALVATFVVIGSAPQATATQPVLAPAAVTLPSDTTTTPDDRSLFEKVGDFASDNATWFIIGIIALAVILAAIFILRGRKKGPSGPKATAAAGASGARPSQGAPSAAEIKRRRRAAMQRAREEERLRRKAGLPAGARPAQALDPVAAEKHAARAGVHQQPKPPVPPVSPEAPTEVTPAPGGMGPGVVAAGATAAGAIGSSGQEDEAEARLREKVEEIKAGQSAVVPPPSEMPPPQAQPGTGGAGPGAAGLAAGAAAAGMIGGREQDTQAGQAEAAHLPGGIPVPADLAEAESRIRADREARDRALESAEQRLRLVEERAEAAERRAAFAEQLAELKAEEGEQERRLREVMERMDRAEARARQAELRAEAAERVASDALRGGGEPAAPQAGPGSQSEPPATSSSQAPPTPSVVPAASAPSASAGTVNINTASFEELRGVEFSVTQATRVLAYRERFGGYGSVEDLARVPGFSPEIIASLRDRISI